MDDKFRSQRPKRGSFPVTIETISTAPPESVEVAFDEHAQELIAAMANRAYHLPGYGYCADLCQYLNNNHPLLGICFRHPLHPIKTGYRLLILVSSMLFGLTVSSFFYLLVLTNDKFKEVVFNIVLYGHEQSVTSGMLMMVFVGGSVHAAYDLGVWYILSCGCCPLNMKCQKYGKMAAILLVLFISAVAALVVLLRVSLEKQQESLGVDVSLLDSAGLMDDQLELNRYRDIDFDDVHFLVAYVSAFALALLVYYPIGSFLFFSGILGCCRLPILGGRPREMELERKRARRRVSRQQSQV